MKNDLFDLSVTNIGIKWKVFSGDRHRLPPYFMILTNSDCQVISGIKSIVLLFLEDFLVADQSKWIKGAASLSLPMYSGLHNSVQQTFSIWMSLPQAYHLVKWLADWEGEREMKWEIWSWHCNDILDNFCSPEQFMKRSLTDLREGLLE